MKNTIKILPGILIIFILVSGFGGCVVFKETEKAEEKIVMPEEVTNITKIESVIEMECSEGIVYYKEKVIWNQESEEALKELLIEEFRESTIGYGVEVKECSVRLESNSSILSCSIHGSKQASWYDFDWFLRPRSLDFLDTPFEKKEQVLVWSGNLNRVPTTININFPYPISNCHEHVWKK